MGILHTIVSDHYSVAGVLMIAFAAGIVIGRASREPEIDGYDADDLAFSFAVGFRTKQDMGAGLLANEEILSAGYEWAAQFRRAPQ